jgi:cobalamin synthase
MFGASRDKGHNLYFIIAALCLGACAAGLGAWLLPAIWFAAFLLWQRLCMTMFGGITGDLLGAFSELSETAMLFALV